MGNAHSKQSDAAFEDCKKQTEERIHKLLSIKGHRTVNDIHRELGNIMWEYVGMARNKKGLETALEKIPALREEFWQNVNVLGSEGSFNQNLERAGRVADFLEFAEVLTLDALHREESCGGHFREESQTEEGEAKRDDEHFCYVGAWESVSHKRLVLTSRVGESTSHIGIVLLRLDLCGHYKGDGVKPELSKEPLTFDNVHLVTRSYK